MKWLRVLWVICALSVSAAAAVDREAFTFTNYDLDVRVEPEQHRLAVRGKITLRNDSSSPQKNLSLQISSSLDWRAIKVDGKMADFISQSYASDIDHTGSLSEAIVTLPAAVAPKATIEIEVGYEGVVLQDATRLTRIGVPENIAKHSEWDEIGKSFSSVRGIGYVAWYPVALESANLSEGNSVEDAVGRWKAKEANAPMKLNFESTAKLDIYFGGGASSVAKDSEAGGKKVDFAAVDGISVPTFIIADYQKLTPDDHSAVFFASGQEQSAKTYADAVTTVVATSVGGAPEDLRIFALPDPDAAAFLTEGILLTPLKSPITNDAMLNIVYAKTFASLRSPRAWVREGLARFAQAMFIGQEASQAAALDYLESHQIALIEAEKALGTTNEAARSLIHAPDGLYLQAKAMFVWWMLRDILDSDPRLTLLDYKASEDTDPAYLQHVMEKTTKRDLTRFFDDWVYHDKGLPDFHVAYVNSAAITNSGFLVTVTVENLGNAGAEVPLTLRMENGEVDKRIEVRGKSKTTVRLQAGSRPVEVVVNDGSVPESDTSNNTYKIVDTAK